MQEYATVNARGSSFFIFDIETLIHTMLTVLILKIRNVIILLKKHLQLFVSVNKIAYHDLQLI